MRNLNVRFKHHKGHHFLHLIRIRHAYDAAHVYQLMSVQYILYPGRIHIISAGYYHPLDPLAEIYEPFFVHHPKISGVYIGHAIFMTSESVGRLFRVVYIFYHHGRSRQTDFAFFSVRNFFLCSRSDYLIESIREWKSYASLFFSVYRSKAAGGDALCSAIALAHRDAGIVFFKESVKSFLQLYGQRVAAAENAFQTRQIYSVQALYSEKSFVESRYSCDKIRFMLLKQLSVAFRVESRYQQASSAVCQHGMYAYSQSETMKYRHDCQHLVSRSEHRIGGDYLL